MRNFTFSGIVILLSSVVFPVIAQNHDKALFRNSEPGFYQNSILRDDRELNTRIAPATAARYFVADLSGLDLPNKIDFYKTSPGIIHRYRMVIRVHAGPFLPRHSLNLKHTACIRCR